MREIASKGFQIDQKMIKFVTYALEVNIALSTILSADVKPVSQYESH